MFFELIKDALLDSVKLLPILFLTYLLMECLEHHASEKMERSLRKIGRFGPAVGAALGCVPQCGFSASASNLYAAGIITQGTLMAVFLATSDEALPILLSTAAGVGLIIKLLLWKLAISVLFGFALDFVLRAVHFRKAPNDLCRDCGCQEESGVLKPALHHTLHIFLFILLINFCLNTAIHLLGEERISGLLLHGSAAQPFLSALFGLIPNCASSVMLTQFYLNGALSFGALIAGLSSGAGIGLAVLLRTNASRRENLQIVLTLYFIAAFSGLLIQVLGL